MSFKSFLREYFTFNRRERNGVFILLAIILLLMFYLFFEDIFFPKEKIDFAEFEKEVSGFEAELKKANDSSVSEKDNYYFSGNNLIADPAEGKEKYFNRKKFPFDSTNHAVRKMYSKKNDSLIIELNSADTTELKKLKGIGSSFAKRIVKYRELLGGYVSKKQLLEVYGFDKEKYDLVSPHIVLDATRVIKININIAAAEEMRKHPYIRWKLANVISSYRKNHGRFASVDAVRKIDLFNDSLFTKLAPYLTAE